MGNPDQHSPANLTQWLRADSTVSLNTASTTPITDGVAVQTWQDESGNLYGLTQNTSGLRPTYRTSIMNGKPGVLFDGTDDVMTAAQSLGNVISNSAFTMLAVVYMLEGSTSATIYSNDAVFADSGGFVGLHVKSGLNVHIYNFDGTADDTSIAATAGKAAIIVARHSGGSIFISRDGGGEASTASGNTTDLTGTLIYGRSFDSVNFGRFYLGEWAIWNTSLSSADIAALVATMRLKWVSFLPAQIETTRNVASRVVRMLRQPVPVVRLTAPLRYADVEIGDDIPLTHFGGPTSSTCAGWGTQTWQRRLIRVLGSDMDLDSGTVQIRGLDVRDYLVTWWDTMVSEESPDSQYQGTARLDTGAARTFTRASVANIESGSAAAQGSRLVVQVPIDVEKLDAGGTILESSGQNEITRSSFVSGVTGLTVSGTSGGGSVSLDTADLLFATSISPNSLTLTAGSTHTEDLLVRFPDTASISSSGIVSVSVDHKDDSATALSVRLQRQADSFYWNHATQAWTSATADNLLTVRTTGARDYLTSINVGSSATTLRTFLCLPTSGTGSRVNHAYHVQLEQRRYASSRIVVDGTTAGSRSADDLKVENNYGERTWTLDHGTAFLQFTPEWNSSELASGVTQVLLEAYFDASNYDRLFWDQATTGFIFRRRLAGVNFDATSAGAVVRGTTYDIAARWTGEDAEEDLAAFTVSVFRDGTKGADAVPGAIPNSITSTGYLRIGMDTSAANQADGWLKHVMITPFVLSDAEIGDLP